MTSRAFIERVCDRCSQVERGTQEPSAWAKILLPFDRPRAVSLVDGKDLCPKCCAELVDWMKSGRQGP
jgi:hypothetical protein